MNPIIRILHSGDLVNIFLKRWQYCLISFVVILATVVTLALRQEKVYEATAKIIIGESLGQRVLGENFGDFRSYLYEQQAFATYPYVLQSNHMVHEIANRLQWHDPTESPELFDQDKSIIRSSLSITRVEESRLFNIRASTTDAKKAQQIANTAADVFIEQSLEKKLESFRKSISWLADQLIDLEYTLEESQKELLSFIENERVTSYGDNSNPSPQGSSLSSLSEVVNTTNQLDSVRIAQELKIANLLQKYTAKHPKVIQARREYENTKQKLQSERKDTESETIRLKQKEIRYSILKRKVDINKELYNSLVQKMKEIDIASAINDKNIQVLEYSKTPSAPVRPNRKKMIFFGFLIATFVSISIPFGIHYWDPTVKTPEEAENLFGLPVLSSIPLFDEKNDSPFPSLVPHSRESESFRKLRTNVRFAFPANKGNCLLITSSGAGEGKSTILSNLALTIADSGKKICVVDTDLRLPRVHSVFSLENKHGLTNYLVGEAKNLDEIIQKTFHGNLDIITSGTSSPKPTELLETQRMKETVLELRKRYDQVLFDSPPSESLIDASILSSYLDGVIFVLQQGRINKSMVRSSIEQLRRVQANICGIVLNQVEKSKNISYYFNHYYDKPKSVSSNEQPVESKKKATS